MPGGRPTDYTEEIGQRICEGLLNGDSLITICKADDMPCRATVYYWLARNSEFSDNYAKARVAQMEHYADEILAIADEGTNDWMMREDPDNPGYRVNGEHINRSRLRVDTRKWLMSKLAPAYADKIQHTGKDGKDLFPGKSDAELQAIIAGEDVSSS